MQFNPTITIDGLIYGIAIIILIGVTVYYAIQNRRMADEMRAQKMIASQPLVIQKPIYEEDVFEGSTSKYFWNFAIWNAGNGPAVELVFSILNAQKSPSVPVRHERKTYLKSGEATVYSPELFQLEEGKYYFVCQYMTISWLTGKETLNQTWLPFEVKKTAKEGKVHVAPGELSFKFDVPESDLLDVFSRSTKPQ